MKCVVSEGYYKDLKSIFLINSGSLALINGIPFDYQHLVQASELALGECFLES